MRECNHEALALPSLNSIKEKIWKTPTAPKIRNFLWKSLSEALPVAELILNRGMKVDERCQICGVEGESIQHVLFECDCARYVWALSGIPQPEWGLQTGRMGVAWVVRNHRGVVIIHSRRAFSSIWSLDDARFSTCLEHDKSTFQ
ncbi:hypothetical protein F2Q68_00038271 [Brassica cretica]|uniref:Reverse transcriptase zinc-binding domain-containing protein n=1 Tax=Brassica cretica TaxID=69181 RepID=A0A8S9MKA7_BRACR|nr:hypothetical protein F2Q68_00038271 [Brassica cretica]